MLFARFAGENVGHLAASLGLRPGTPNHGAAVRADEALIAAWGTAGEATAHSEIKPRSMARCGGHALSFQTFEAIISPLLPWAKHQIADLIFQNRGVALAGV